MSFPFANKFEEFSGRVGAIFNMMGAEEKQTAKQSSSTRDQSTFSTEKVSEKKYPKNTSKFSVFSPYEQKNKLKEIIERKKDKYRKSNDNVASLVNERRGEPRTRTLPASRREFSNNSIAANSIKQSTDSTYVILDEDSGDFIGYDNANINARRSNSVEAISDDEPVPPKKDIANAHLNKNNSKVVANMKGKSEKKAPPVAFLKLFNVYRLKNNGLQEASDCAGLGLEISKEKINIFKFDVQLTVNSTFLYQFQYAVDTSFVLLENSPTTVLCEYKGDAAPFRTFIGDVSARLGLDVKTTRLEHILEIYKLMGIPPPKKNRYSSASNYTRIAPPPKSQAKRISIPSNKNSSNYDSSTSGDFNSTFVDSFYPSGQPPFRRETRSRTAKAMSQFSGKTFTIDGDDEEDANIKYSRQRWTEAELQEKFFVYPKTGNHAITIHREDYNRLDEGEYLNDSVIEFYIKWMFDNSMDPAVKEQMHIFNSFLYTQLTKKEFPEDNYERVKKWSAKFDLFDKKYIVIPINESLHWYLAIIYNPGALLLDDDDVNELLSSNTEAEQICIEEEEAEREKLNAQMVADVLAKSQAKSTPLTRSSKPSKSPVSAKDDPIVIADSPVKPSSNETLDLMDCGIESLKSGECQVSTPDIIKVAEEEVKQPLGGQTSKFFVDSNDGVSKTGLEKFKREFSPVFNDSEQATSSFDSDTLSQTTRRNSIDLTSSPKLKPSKTSQLAVVIDNSRNSSPKKSQEKPARRLIIPEDDDEDDVKMLSDRQAYNKKNTEKKNSSFDNFEFEMDSGLSNQKRKGCSSVNGGTSAAISLSSGDENDMDIDIEETTLIEVADKPTSYRSKILADNIREQEILLEQTHPFASSEVLTIQKKILNRPDPESSLLSESVDRMDLDNPRPNDVELQRARFEEFAKETKEERRIAKNAEMKRKYSEAEGEEEYDFKDPVKPKRLVKKGASKKGAKKEESAQKLLAAKEKAEKFATSQREKCHIVILNSLGKGAYIKVKKTLNEYLKKEAWDKKQRHINPDVRVKFAKAPSQPNFCDCGVYLMHYVKSLFVNCPGHDPEVYFDRVWNNEAQADWFTHKDIRQMRKDIRKLMDDLTVQEKEHNQKKEAEKKMLRNEPGFISDDDDDFYCEIIG